MLRLLSCRRLGYLVFGSCCQFLGVSLEPDLNDGVLFVSVEVLLIIERLFLLFKSVKILVVIAVVFVKRLQEVPIAGNSVRNMV